MAMLDSGPHRSVAKPSWKPAERVHALLRMAFYNPGLMPGQVQTEELYDKWVLGNLRRDVLAMTEEYEMDVICLCELGPIAGGLEKTLGKWMTPDRVTAVPGAFPLVERMLLDLVHGLFDWRAFAMAHYGLLIKRATVNLVEEPVLVALHSPHPQRVAMKFKISPLTRSGEKPAEATEIWNVHSPAPNNKFGIEARRGVWDTISEKGASRRVVGGDMNYAKEQAEEFNQKLEQHLRWNVLEPVKARHGDLLLYRNVVAKLVHVPIGKTYIDEKSKKSSDAHNVCAISLTCPVEGVASPLRTAADTALTAATATIGGEQSKT